MRKDCLNNPFLKTALETARKAGRYAKKRKGSIKSITFKGSINLVTDVDKSCENIIISGIKKDFPSHGILSEESNPTTNSSPYKWIIDPLDGTTNYSKGLPIYSVSVALEYRGRIIAGAVYDPERDEMFYAERGKGAFCNKKRIHVSKEKKLSNAFLVTGFSYNVQTTDFDNVKYFKAFLKRTLAVRRLGSAALDLSYVAGGRFDGFWELNLHPWDTAAGSLIVEEAGGKITRYDGKKFSCYDKEMLASNAHIHNPMLQIIRSTK